MYIYIFSLIMMYILVQYKEDDILQVCNSSQVKLGQNNNIIAKYCDGYFYSCNIICRNSDKYILGEIKKNLELKLPMILLELDNSTWSKKSLVESCENENKLIISSEGFVESKFDILELCDFSNNHDVLQRTNKNNTSKKSVAEASENDKNIIISSENSEDMVENEMDSSELHEFANNQEQVQQRTNMNNKCSEKYLSITVG